MNLEFRRVEPASHLVCRVRRFQRALRLAREQPTVRWAAIAGTTGYCDQAHMT